MSLMNRPSWSPSGFAWASGTSVDLGAGRFPRNPLRARTLVAVDIFEGAPFEASNHVEYRRATPGDALPIEDGEADCCTAFDFIEHIPRFDRLADGTAVNPFIELMNEVCRILRPGGLFIAVTPCFPRDAAFVDPTHVNTITTGTHEYFSGHMHARSLGYRFTGEFDCLAAEWLPTSSTLWECVDLCDRGGPDPLEAAESSSLIVKKLARSSIGWRITGRRPFHFLWVLSKPTRV